MNKAVGCYVRFCSFLNMHDPRWPDGTTPIAGDSVLWGVTTMFLMMDNANNAMFKVCDISTALLIRNLPHFSSS